MGFSFKLIWHKVWTWVWVNSWSWWWTGRPGVPQFMGLQSVGHDWATELTKATTSGWDQSLYSCILILFTEYFIIMHASKILNQPAVTGYMQFFSYYLKNALIIKYFFRYVLKVEFLEINTCEFLRLLRWIARFSHEKILPIYTYICRTQIYPTPYTSASSKTIS